MEGTGAGSPAPGMEGTGAGESRAGNGGRTWSSFSASASGVVVVIIVAAAGSAAAPELRRRAGSGQSLSPAARMEARGEREGVPPREWRRRDSDPGPPGSIRVRDSLGRAGGPGPRRQEEESRAGNGREGSGGPAP